MCSCAHTVYGVQPHINTFTCVSHSQIYFHAVLIDPVSVSFSSVTPISAHRICSIANSNHNYWNRILLFAYCPDKIMKREFKNEVKQNTTVSYETCKLVNFSHLHSVFSFLLSVFLPQAYLRKSAKVYLGTRSPGSLQPQSSVSNLFLTSTLFHSRWFSPHPRWAVPLKPFGGALCS